MSLPTLAQLDIRESVDTGVAIAIVLTLVALGSVSQARTSWLARLVVLGATCAWAVVIAGKV